MSFQACLDTIEEKTGLTPRQFVDLAGEKGFDQPRTKAGVVIDWLKADYGPHRDESDTLWLDGKATRPL